MGLQNLYWVRKHAKRVHLQLNFKDNRSEVFERRKICFMSENVTNKPAVTDNDA